MKMTLNFSSRFSVIALCIIFSVLLSGHMVRAATFETPCNAAQLVADVATANTNNQPDTINLAEDCTYPLTATLVIANDGAGNTLTVNGNGAIFNGSDSIRVLRVNMGANLMRREVHIEEGLGVCDACAPGTGFAAGIWNEGTLEIVDGSVRDSHATDFAGAILNDGTLTLTNVVISGNSGGVGGGIYNGGGTLTITDSVFESNTANGAGGIFNVGGDVTIDNSVFSLNTALEGGGVGNEINGVVTITNSTFYSNSAVGNVNGGGNGGAIVNYATLSLSNTTLSQNSASKLAGAVYSGSSSPGNPAATSITNVTIANNTAGTSGSAIYNNTNSSFTVANSLIASAGTTVNCSAIVPITDNGFNITTDSSCPVGFTVTPLSSMRLGALLYNGGTTPGYALLPGSVAIDMGNCVAGNDQRGAGFARPVDLIDIANVSGGNGCDVGAYELQSLPAGPISPPAATPEPNYFTEATPTLTWSRITWAVTYEIEVANNPEFTGAAQYAVDADELSVVVDTPPLTDGKFYWQVRAISPNRVGGWSARQIFTIDLP